MIQRVIQQCQPNYEYTSPLTKQVSLRHLSYECTDRHEHEILRTRFFSAAPREMAEDDEHPKYPPGLFKRVLLNEEQDGRGVGG